MTIATEDAPTGRLRARTGRGVDRARLRHPLRGRRRIPGEGRAWVLVGVMTALAAAAMAAMPTHRGGLAGSVHIPWWALAVAFAATDMAQVHFHFREQGMAINLGEVPLMVGLAFCSPVGLVAARLVGTFVSLGIKDRQPLVKLSFNLTDRALETPLAVMVAYAVIGGAAPISPRGWLALTTGSAVTRLVGDGCIFSVIWLTAGRPAGTMLRELALTGPMVLVTGTALAVICVSVLWVNVWAVWSLLLLVAVVTVVHIVHHRLRRRYSNLVRLYDFTGQVAAVRPSADLVEQVLDQCRSILRASRASLLLTAGTGYERAVMSDSGNSSEPAARPGRLEAMVLSSGQALLAPRNANGEVGDALTADGFPDALVAPVIGDDGVMGVLLVAGRLADMDPFQDSELMLFGALAKAAGVALRRGQLVEELRAEVTAKQHQAYHDPLTGLPNRAFFAQRLGEATVARARGERLAVLLMDLDEFKEINDTLGHDVGDAVLVAIGARLVATVGDAAFVTRLGGDEFAILVPREPEEGFLTLAQRVADAVQEPLAIEDMVLQLRTSIGLAICPDHGEKPSVLLQRADVAMYSAKGSHIPVVEYTAEKDHHSTRRLGLVGDLRQAVATDGLDLYYQPKADLTTGCVYGVEALLRWSHPVHGMVPPDEFIPMAEHSGLIGPVTSWVLRRALTQQAAWAARGIQLTVAVNISARSLLQPELVDEVARLLHETGVAPRNLTLEITESTVMVDLVRSVVVLDQLSAMGVRLSVDDFGTGYSSLSRLTKLPVDEVKIDKSLVFNMLRDQGDLAVVGATIDLARHLELEVVAEGIEDGLTWERLRQLGCGRAQGYYLSRPVPARELEEWLEHWEHKRSLLNHPTSSVVAMRR
ncbi:MAG TPA: bifunctional diguanylate cyclase/phosphodiesterase [Acidimicrobiales bacterium]|nr:bifunctional diguanylate cyclase/phosphodiesterase [Acidimicrobiales bacterium]